MSKNLNKILFASALAIAAVGFGVSDAQAAPITFTWSPGAVGLGAVGNTITANNFNVSDFADIVIPGGTFTENGALLVTQFLQGGSPQFPTNFNSGAFPYSLYFTFTATGTVPGAIPAPGSGGTLNGAFTSLSYTLWANPTSPPTITINPGGTPSITGNASAFALATGSLISGTFGLTAPAGGGYSPSANLNLSLIACSVAGQSVFGGTCAGDETAFFTDPLPQDIALLIGNFGATTSVTTLTPGSPTLLDINGGGGNLTLEKVPEPATLGVLGVGLVGIAFGFRRRRRSA